MKRHFIFALCLFLSALLLLLCACRQTTSDAPTDPTVTASVPETTSAGTTGEGMTTPPDTDTDELLTTTQPPALSLDGTLYEYRNNFEDTFLPTASEKVIGGRLFYEENGDERPTDITIECEGKKYEMKYLSTVYREREGVDDLPVYRNYTTRGWSIVGITSSVTLDTSDRIVDMKLAGSFLPEDFTEADILQVAMRIAAQFYPVDPETLTCALYSASIIENGLVWEEGFRCDEDARYYKVSYARYMGEVRTGEYIEVTFNPFYSSMATLSVTAGYADVDKFEKFSALTEEDAMGCIRQSFPTLGLEGARVTYAPATLLFTELDGRPCLTVDCVVTLADRWYETSLCYCFSEVKEDR